MLLGRNINYFLTERVGRYPKRVKHLVICQAATEFPNKKLHLISYIRFPSSTKFLPSPFLPTTLSWFLDFILDFFSIYFPLIPQLQVFLPTLQDRQFPSILWIFFLGFFLFNSSTIHPSSGNPLIFLLFSLDFFFDFLGFHRSEFSRAP